MNIRKILLVSTFLCLGVAGFMHFHFYDRAAQIEGYNPAKQWIDWSFGSLSLSFSLLMGCLLLKVRSLKDVLSLCTPNKRWKLVLLMNLAWLAHIPSIVFYYSYRQGRYDYPAEADSIAIPIFYGCVGTLVVWPVLNLIMLLLLYKKSLPAKLASRFPSYGVLAGLFELFTGLCIAFLLVWLGSDIYYGDIGSIPINLILIYCAFSLRAAHSDPETAANLNKSTTDRFDQPDTMPSLNP